MDDRLLDRLFKINEQIDRLKGLEKTFLTLAAHEKVLYSKLYLNTIGANVEIRKALVYSTQDWINFSLGLADAETNYLESKRRYELSLKAYDAEHLSFKSEISAIKRQL